MDLFGILIGPVRRMSHVHRYSSFQVHRKENVAEHSWWVAFISYLISMDLIHQGRELNAGLVLGRAIMHDISECVSGDIIRSYKHTNQRIRRAMNDADELNMKEITSKMGGVGDDVYYDWSRAKSGIEGQIVAFADMVAVVVYCREEYLSGNREIAHVMKEMYETWFFNYHHDDLLKGYADRMFPGRRYQDAFMYGDPVGRIMGRSSAPIMKDHSEGQVGEHDFKLEGEPLG